MGALEDSTRMSQIELLKSGIDAQIKFIEQEKQDAREATIAQLSNLSEKRNIS